MAGIFKELLGDKLVTSPILEHESQLPTPNQLRNRIIIKNKKLRQSDCGAGNVQFSSGGRAGLHRTVTLEDAPDNDEEYDSDFGEDEFEDETGTVTFFIARYGCYVLNLRN